VVTVAVGENVTRVGLATGPVVGEAVDVWVGEAVGLAVGVERTVGVDVGVAAVVAVAVGDDVGGGVSGAVAFGLGMGVTEEAARAVPVGGVGTLSGGVGLTVADGDGSAPSALIAKAGIVGPRAKTRKILMRIPKPRVMSMRPMVSPSPTMAPAPTP